ncbi:MAG: oligosaccharide flippase family protein [Actinomycetota bacterium]|nr:oligosaccharide flippase family protein [Actinomycetota bacterium]
MTDRPAGEAAGTAEAKAATAAHIRGSSLLFAGRLMSLLLNMATQVLIVRLLTKSDFGAFAYGLALIPAARTFVSLGHQQALTRFLSLYEEERAYNKLFGTIVMEIGTIVSTGLLLFAGLFALKGALAGTAVSDQQAVVVLLILILLAPIEALEKVFEGIFAVFSRPRAVFFRRYVLTPGLRLLFVALLLAFGGSVTFLAAGYVAAGAFGIVTYAALSVHFFRRRGLLEHFHLRSIVMPFREVFGFALPLLSTELVNISMVTGTVVLLGHFAGAVEVAAYRAVLPTARLNQLVFWTFMLLFVPLATRMFARGDREGMRDAYWRTAVWLAVFSFPIFVLTVPLAEPTTVALFGERYRDSATVLALVSLGFYVNAALGYNALTLQTYGKLRYVVTVNVITGLTNVVLSLVLIPRQGAVGAAIANAVTLVLQNTLNQAGLAKGIGVPLFEWRYVRAYLVIIVAVLAVGAIQLALSPPLVVGLGLAVLASLVVFLANRDLLEMGATFPELLRVPLVRRLVASESGT